MDHENARDVPLSANDSPVTIPVVHESLEVSKRTVDTGSVRVRVDTERVTETLAVERVSHRAKIDRRTMDIPVEAEYEPHQEGDEWVIPVFEYKPVVTLQLFLKEEIRIAHQIERVEEITTVPLQRQRVIIERRTGDNGDWRQVEEES